MGKTVKNTFKNEKFLPSINNYKHFTQASIFTKQQPMKKRKSNFFLLVGITGNGTWS